MAIEVAKQRSITGSYVSVMMAALVIGLPPIIADYERLRAVSADSLVALRRAEQTMRNLATEMEGDDLTIAMNECANIRAAIGKAQAGSEATE